MTHMKEMIRATEVGRHWVFHRFYASELLDGGKSFWAPNLGNANKQVQHSSETFTTLAIHRSRLSSTSAIVATAFWFTSSRIPLGVTSGKRSFKLAAQPLIDGYKIYRSFARFAATIACKFSPCHRTDQPMTIPGCPGLFGFAMWIVAITILLITYGPWVMGLRH